MLFGAIHPNEVQYKTWLFQKAFVWIIEYDKRKLFITVSEYAWYFGMVVKMRVAHIDASLSTYFWVYNLSMAEWL